MPTPSSDATTNLPPSHPPHLASSCPDLIEDEHLQPPQSPSSWHPCPPAPYGHEVNDIALSPLTDYAPTSPPYSDPSLRSRLSSVSTRPDDDTAVAPRPSPTAESQDLDNNTLKPSERMLEDMGIADSRAVSSPLSTTSASGTLDVVASPASSVPSKYSHSQQQSIDAKFPEEPLAHHLSLLDIAPTRKIPLMSSTFLRPGSKFQGTQKSDAQEYDVQVEIKYVDFREYFLCGYLRIQGLTTDHPTLTTYFEGEIIGPQYGFITQHPNWGASVADDMSHWDMFQDAFEPYKAKATCQTPRNVTQSRHMFMRWKEQFLVPDHRVRTISGASFEGFYYICFDQLKGVISGIYFHKKSEKFQRLDLKHIENRGCFGALEFR